MRILIEVRSDSEIPTDDLEKALRSAVESVSPTLSVVGPLRLTEISDQRPPRVQEEELELPQLSYNKIF
jgi:hypothetical protein